MHAYIITGANNEERSQELERILKTEHISAFDTVTIHIEVEDETIPIAAIRDLKSRLVLAPNDSPFMAGIIPDAHKMKTEAQNALLKLLEEPPPRVKLYLETAYPESLLPTILSRCQIISLQHGAKSDDMETAVQEFISLTSASPGNIIQQVELIATDRIKAKQWTLTALEVGRHVLLETLMGKRQTLEIPRITKVLRNLQKAHTELSVNVNPKLVLDSVFLDG